MYNSYQLASARVVSLTTVKLLDDLIIPINTSFILQFINSSIYHSIDVLQQHILGYDLNTGKYSVIYHFNSELYLYF
jgi:hypothetical protein